ncbi:MAG: HAD-IIA family hydrolase [Chloroflexi bacterium]|nr:HAD-IIA family hydrolase [Chloroflexota bacterium]
MLSPMDPARLDTELPDVRAFLFDIDGVLLHGADAVPGAAAGLRHLQELGYVVAFLTNDNMAGPGPRAELLASHGYPVQEGSVITAGMVAAQAARAWRGNRVLVFGSPDLVARVDEAVGGALTVQDYVRTGGDIEVLLMGRNDELFDYEHVALLARALVRNPNATFFATNTDRRVPSGPRDFVPGTGAMIRAVEWVADRTATPLAKPQKAAAELAVAYLGLAPGEVVMVGDQPDADILMARRAGLHSVLVLTGYTQAGSPEPPAEQMPELVVGSAADFRRLSRRPPRRLT